MKNFWDGVTHDEVKALIRHHRLDPFTAHEVNIARQTLRMPDAILGVMGGMTKEQAKRILRKAVR